MSADDERDLELLGSPTHIILTCDYHERACSGFRARWGCKTLIHERQVASAECEWDGLLRHGDLIWEGVEVIRVPDVRFAEELSFFVRADKALIVGDLLSGGRRDRGIAAGQLGIAAPELCVDLDKARQSLGHLLSLPFEILCFGHGSPIRTGARDVLRRYVESDAVWAGLEKLRTERRQSSD
ncbi:MAG: hypothetical protein AAF721_17310 [Myxococcota bacterium]